MSDPIDKVAVKICRGLGFDLGPEVGAGGFKKSYRIDNKEGVQYALKVYKVPEVTGRTKAEIDAMIRCDHPNIAKVLHIDSEEFDGDAYVYLLEEFFDGGTLATLLKTRPLDRQTTLGVGEALIGAISHLHALRLVHRDIKPENILFRKNIVDPILTDFGIVRNLDATSQTASWLPRGPGTPFYASPEQLNNEKQLIDWRSDQFSLGVTLSMSQVGFHPYGEPNWSPEKVIEAVSTRTGPSSLFETKAKELRVPALLKMLLPWPAERHRLPASLIDAWRQQ